MATLLDAPICQFDAASEERLGSLVLKETFSWQAVASCLASGIQGCDRFRTRADSLWPALHLPLPAAGIRLLIEGDVGAINVTVDHLEGVLREAAPEQDAHFAELKSPKTTETLGFLP